MSTVDYGSLIAKKRHYNMQTDKSINQEEQAVEEKVITAAEKRAAMLAARKKNLQRQKRGKLPRSLR
tara:strand:+ start:52 stop:252 length:201 start_codon:yes stop_codon:yes gene_type:complete